MKRVLSIECEGIIDVHVREVRGGRIHFKLNLNEYQWKLLKEEVKKYEKKKKTIPV